VCLASRRQDQSHYWSILLTCALGIAHIESVCGSLLEALTLWRNLRCVQHEFSHGIMFSVNSIFIGKS
jgi:hypothetical protein